MVTLTDAAIAERFLRNALGGTAKPALDDAQVADLMTNIAATKDATGATAYTTDSLNLAAATGWMWKAGLTSDQYNIGGTSGTLSRSDWYKQCAEMAIKYGSGLFSVTGESSSKSGRTIGAIGLVGSNVDPVTLGNV